MKRLLAVALLVAAFSASAQQLFSDADLDVTLLTDTPAVRNKQFITFAAESTFKVSVDNKLPAGTKMKLIWTVNCAKKEQRIVLASITAPGQVPVVVSREEMVALAKKEPFVAPKDEVSKRVIAAVCR